MIANIDKHVYNIFGDIYEKMDYKNNKKISRGNIQ